MVVYLPNTLQAPQQDFANTKKFLKGEKYLLFF
jgi:hypothetical protein